jgi:hypothetical protein
MTSNRPVRPRIHHASAYGCRAPSEAVPLHNAPRPPDRCSVTAGALASAHPD